MLGHCKWLTWVNILGSESQLCKALTMSTTNDTKVFVLQLIAPQSDTGAISPYQLNIEVLTKVGTTWITCSQAHTQWIFVVRLQSTNGTCWWQDVRDYDKISSRTSPYQNTNRPSESVMWDSAKCACWPWLNTFMRNKDTTARQINGMATTRLLDNSNSCCICDKDVKAKLNKRQ